MPAINGWRYGTRHAPRWARELLATKIERAYAGTHPIDIAKQLRQVQDHPGLMIGAKNLAAYNARRNQSRD